MVMKVLFLLPPQEQKQDDEENDRQDQRRQRDGRGFIAEPFLRVSGEIGLRRGGEIDHLDLITRLQGAAGWIAVAGVTAPVDALPADGKTIGKCRMIGAACLRNQRLRADARMRQPVVGEPVRASHRHGDCGRGKGIKQQKCRSSPVHLLVPFCVQI